MKVAGLFRYPVKAMAGESLEQAALSVAGIRGDRALALRDQQTGAIVSAKHPQRWSSVRTIAATWSPSEVTIVLPDGERLSDRSPDVDRKLSAALGRQVQLICTPPEGEVLYRSWPDVADLAPLEVRNSATPVEDGVTAGPLGLLAPGTFFDAGQVHIIFSSSLRQLAKLSGTDVDVRRFRPNLVIDDDDERPDPGFAEDDLIGSELAVGGATLRLDCPTPRCIVPTLPVGDLPRNLELLRALARHHRADVANLGRFACFGAYASVIHEGSVRVGDPISPLSSAERFDSAG